MSDTVTRAGSQPSTAQPSTAQPSTGQPGTAQPRAAQPNAAKRFARPIMQRTLIVNAAIVIALAATSVYVVRQLTGWQAILLVLLLAVVGLAVTLLFNFLALRATSRVLADLTRAMETVHKGEMGGSVSGRTSDPHVRRLAASFNDMCRRLEGESLNYAAKQVNTIEEERRRIGRELHDETNQTLAATLIRLDLADKALQDHDAVEAHKQVSSAADLIKHSMEEIKLLVYDLRPVMLDDFGLVPTLRWYIQSHLQGAGPTIVTDFDADLRVSPEVETALYRIVQEALSNAVRHASATKVVVRLETKPGFVDLAVIDNGRGFDREALHREGSMNGLGLLSLKERVELVGGTLNIESSVGRGTRLYVVIPQANPVPASAP
jgi:signal transduction histidine kinase